MHELSIANSIVEIANEYAQANQAQQVQSVTVRIGALSCVNKSSLEFGFDLVANDTLVEGAILTIIEVPVAVYCSKCERQVELPGIQSFCCPICQTPSADIRQGQELEVETIEILCEETLDAESSV